MSWRDKAVRVPTPAAGGWRASAERVPAPAEEPADLTEAPEPPGRLEALGRGIIQGGTLGFGEEMGAGLQSNLTQAAQFMPRGVQEALGLEHVGELDPIDVYRQARAENRAENAAAQRAHPYLYGAGEVAGGLVPAAIPGLAGGAKGAKLMATLGGAAGMGALGGLGYSEADLTQGDIGGAAADVGMGAALGTIAHPVAKVIGAGARKLARPLARQLEKFGWGRALSAMGTMKASRKALQRSPGLEQAGKFAAEEVLEPLQSLEGAANKLGQIKEAAGKRIGELEDEFVAARKRLLPPKPPPGAPPAPETPVGPAPTREMPGAAETVAAGERAARAKTLITPQAWQDFEASALEGAAPPTQSMRAIRPPAAAPAPPTEIVPISAVAPTTRPAPMRPRAPRPATAPYQRDEALLEAAAYGEMSPQERDEALLRAMQGRSAPRTAQSLPAGGAGASQDEQALRALYYESLTPAEQADLELAAQEGGTRLTTRPQPRKMPGKATRARLLAEMGLSETEQVAAPTLGPSPAAPSPGRVEPTRPIRAPRQAGAVPAAQPPPVAPPPLPPPPAGTPPPPPGPQVPTLRAEDLRQSILDEAAKLEGLSGLDPKRRALIRLARGITDKGEIGLKRALEIERSFDPQAKYEVGKPSEKMEAAREARALFREAIDQHLLDLANQAERSGVDLDLVQELRDQRSKYGIASKLHDAAMDRILGKGANLPFGLPEVIAAGSAGGAMLARGHGLGAAAAAAGGAIGSRLLRDYSNSLMAPAALGVSRALRRAATAPAGTAARRAIAASQPAIDTAIRRRLRRQEDGT